MTASHLSDVLSRAAGGKGEGNSRRTYKAALAAEIMSNISETSGVKTKAMEGGTATEPFARSAYETLYDVRVDQVGFVLHPRIDRFGASPDGLVIANIDGVDTPIGAIEIKCGYRTTHVNWLDAGVPPAEHQLQMLAEMACTGLPWCDFVSFHKDMTPKTQLFVVRFFRDEARINRIEAEVKTFLTEVDELVERLQLLEEM